MQKVAIQTPTIRLDQFLKWANLAGSGGQAKQIINEGMVQVNGEPETRRGKTLSVGDIVELHGKKYQVTAGE